jgi:mannosylglycoprotein endo-beta-mannosidase
MNTRSAWYRHIPIFKKQIDGYIEEVPTPIWDYHKYIPYSKPGKVHDQIELYGHPKDLDNFCEKVSYYHNVFNSGTFSSA